MEVNHALEPETLTGAGQKSQEGDESGYFFGLDSV
jgi:hypothetical protein